MRRLMPLVCAAAAVSLFASGALADVLCYEMSVGPDSSNAYGANAWTKIADGFADTEFNDSNAPEWAGLQNGTHGPAGSGRFSDTSDLNDPNNPKVGRNNGFRSPPWTGTETEHGLTVDMRVRAEVKAWPQNGRNMAIMSGVWGACALQVGRLSNDDVDNSIRLRFIHSNSVDYTLDVDATSEAPDSFRMIRFSLPSDVEQPDSTYYLYVYDLETQTTPGSWDLLYRGRLYGGGMGFPSVGKGQVGLGDNASGGTGVNTSRYLVDWIRIDNRVARGATDPIIPPTLTDRPSRISARSAICSLIFGFNLSQTSSSG